MTHPDIIDIRLPEKSTPRPPPASRLERALWVALCLAIGAAIVGV